MLTQISKKQHKTIGDKIVFPDISDLNINTDSKGIVIAITSLLPVLSKEYTGNKRKEIQSIKPTKPYIRNVPRSGL